jgi:ribokinase
LQLPGGFQITDNISGCASALLEEGINSSYLTRDSNVGTGTACVMISTDTSQNSIIVLPRANLALTPTIVDEALQSILAQSTIQKDASIFIAQCEMRMATIAAGLRIAHTEGMTTIFNAAPIPPEPFLNNLFTLVDILVVNEAEATTLTGMTVETPANTMETGANLLAKGVKHVIITLGAQGCLWSTKEGDEGGPSHQFIPAIPVKPVDSTAAGDAFCGALAAKLAEGMEMKEALRWANAAGAVAVTKLGALPSLPKEEEVEALLKEADGEYG